jgi:signal transduction histidine kinase/DNA-binding response OmpR family regulator
LFLDSKKRLWIGTTQGISRLDIKNIPKALAPPKLYIEQVSVNGHTQAHHPHLQLPYQAQLKISFKALSYAFAQGVSYQYRLNNSPNWQTTQLNAIEYSSLPNGSHIFEVRAKKLNSDWSAPQKLIFEVVPSFWHTHWAILLYIFSSALLVYGIVKWRSQRLMREKIKLEQVVIKRTYELAQQKEEMAAQAEKLKEMDQVKSQFFSNISHELRTPLTLIQAPIHKIIDTTQEDDTKEYAHLISNSTNRLLRLINQLLDLAKLEDNQLILQPRLGKLNQFLTNNIQAFELLAQQKGITLELTLPKEEVLYEFDHDKFEKIIFNLVSNALKFTPAQGKVSVALSQTPQALLLKVSDTGQGIPSNALPFIFDRFYQVDGSQTRLHEGTGIGLALVKELVKLHEGSIVVDSQLQHGSTFTVTLPLRQTNQVNTSTQSRVMSAQQDGKTAHTQPPNNTHKNGQAKTVLVVEDNQTLRNFIANELGANYKVIEASNGNEGIDEAKKEIPDLIITDLMMPHTDGLELLSTLRQFPPTQHIPIIILSARASIDNKIKGLQFGADDYLTKPFSPEELSLKVHNIFERVEQLKITWQAQMDKAGIAIEPSKVTVNSMDTEFINQALQIIENNIDNVLFDVTAFCQAIGMSRSNLHKKLKALTNLSTTEFIRTIRLKRASDLIEQNKGRIEEIALESGFNDVAYFSRCFKKQFGITPKEYQQTHSKND